MQNDQRNYSFLLKVWLLLPRKAEFNLLSPCNPWCVSTLGDPAPSIQPSKTFTVRCSFPFIRHLSVIIFNGTKTKKKQETQVCRLVCRAQRPMNDKVKPHLWVWCGEKNKVLSGQPRPASFFFSLFSFFLGLSVNTKAATEMKSITKVAVAWCNRQ